MEKTRNSANVDPRTRRLAFCALFTALGVVLGVGATLLQQHFGLIEIPAETFLTKSYPVEFRPGDLAAER